MITSDFAIRIYTLLGQVPAGRVVTYQTLARAAGCGSARAVGQALRRNPSAPVVPCHRVIRTDGRPGGYQGTGGGRALQRKLALLAAEGVHFKEGRLAEPARLIPQLVLHGKRAYARFRIMKFIHDDFMLETDAARELYHEHAAPQPIVDYHCHLSPEEVAADKRWENLTQLWLYGDHYKWRAMRSNGVDEHFCTGKASDRERFDKFAETMPYLLRNPMYHWSHLELARYFDIDDLLLSPETADEIWERTQSVCRQPGMSARGLMERSHVVLVCTTDDPADSLEHHLAVKADTAFGVQMLPTWRPDKVFAIHRTAFFNSWVDRMGEAAGMRIDTFATLRAALQQRHDFFHQAGCRLSDYGLETVLSEPYQEGRIEAIFQKVREGGQPDVEERRVFQSALHYECARMDSASGWTMQIHYGAMRNNNTRMFEALGPDTGFDSIGDWPVAEGLSRFMDRLEREDSLPKTILYTLNPQDNEVLATMLGNFQGDGVPGRIQLGSGWWFNDQTNGMLRQLEALSQLGLLSRFVGMLTDSRSFLSYTRHEYFRRLLCNLLGSEMERGLIPTDMELVGRMVRDVSYNNAASYFGFDLEPGV